MDIENQILARICIVWSETFKLKQQLIKLECGALHMLTTWNNAASHKALTNKLLQVVSST